MTLVRASSSAVLPPPLPDAAAPAPPPPVRPAPLLEVSGIDTELPQPQIRAEYRNSGMWRADSPVPPPVR
ncbi:MAG: hypothetical protein M3N07_09685, partial [Pseudomonadota bacterium]|nr:hypothetical protein [Pseudomonadota bacterium]